MTIVVLGGFGALRAFHDSDGEKALEKGAGSFFCFQLFPRREKELRRRWIGQSFPIISFFFSSTKGIYYEAIIILLSAWSSYIGQQHISDNLPHSLELTSLCEYDGSAVSIYLFRLEVCVGG